MLKYTSLISETKVSRAKEYLELFWINLTVKLKNIIENSKIVTRYYSNSLFRKVDINLACNYAFHNPYLISKKFLINKGEDDIYAYGETPLTTLDSIVEQCDISKNDTVFELGCGRGRGCFWLNTTIGCKVVGIEYIPEFVNIANQIKNKYKLNTLEFRNEDFLESNINNATVIYLYGTCFTESFIKKMLSRFEKLPSGTKIITVSYSLTDYSGNNSFEVMKRFSANFTWGETDVYLHLKK